MGKENGKLEGRGKVFLPSNSPECLEWLYSLHQIAVSIYEIFFCLNQFIFEERLCLFGSGLSEMMVHIAPGHLALQEGQDWKIMGNVLGCMFFFFLFSFIYW